MQDLSLSVLQLLSGTGLLAGGVSRAGGSVMLEDPYQKTAVAQAAEGNSRRMAPLHEEAAVSSQGKGFLEVRLLEQWTITYCSPPSKV